MTPCSKIPTVPQSGNLPTVSKAVRPRRAPPLIVLRSARRLNVPPQFALPPPALQHFVPPEVLSHLQEVNAQWLNYAASQKLQLHVPDTQCSIVLLGVCFWAPLQGQLVADALQQLQPDHILIEQPQTSSKLLLPHPEWIQTMMDHMDDINKSTQQQEQQQQQQQQQQHESWQQVLHLQQDLASSVNPAAQRVERDILDPFESFGYYAGLDFVRQPEGIADVLQSCGFIPGKELVTAAEYALAQGTRLSCLDAPIKLQESWVKGLLANTFTNEELDQQALNSYSPIKDFNTNQDLAAAVLPQAAHSWDKQLATAASQLQAAAVQQQQQQGDAVGGSSDLLQQQAEQQGVLLFKVSKATAAALLAPDEAQQTQVLGRMARLQPLKWRHFALRQNYMAQQLKEAAAAAARRANSNSSSSSSSNGAPKVPTVLAIVGRQHCAALRKLWQDPTSSLWKTEVPRSFAPSVVEADSVAAGGVGGAAAAAKQAADSSSSSS